MLLLKFVTTGFAAKLVKAWCQIEKSLCAPITMSNDILSISVLWSGKKGKKSIFNDKTPWKTLQRPQKLKSSLNPWAKVWQSCCQMELSQRERLFSSMQFWEPFASVHTFEAKAFFYGSKRWKKCISFLCTSRKPPGWPDFARLTPKSWKENPQQTNPALGWLWTPRRKRNYCP